jgi:hypothetical protein
MCWRVAELMQVNRTPMAGADRHDRPGRLLSGNDNDQRALAQGRS